MNRNDRKGEGRETDRIAALEARVTRLERACARGRDRYLDEDLKARGMK